MVKEYRYPKHLKGLNVQSEVLSIKVMPGRTPGDFLKPSLISRMESNSGAIHSMAMENTLTFLRQNQHNVQKNCLGHLCTVRIRRKTDLHLYM